MTQRMTDAEFARVGEVAIALDPECRGSTLAYAQAIYAEARRARESEARLLGALRLARMALTRPGGPEFGSKGRDRDILETLRTAITEAEGQLRKDAGPPTDKAEDSR